jgi:hypothetical protein
MSALRHEDGYPVFGANSLYIDFKTFEQDFLPSRPTTMTTWGKEMKRIEKDMGEKAIFRPTRHAGGRGYAYLREEPASRRGPVVSFRR